MIKRIICLILSISLLVCGICNAEALYDAEYSPEYKFIGNGDIGFPIEKLLMRIGYFNISKTNDKDNSEPYMDDAAEEALIQFQIDAGLEPTGVFDCETLYIVTGCIMEDNEMVWIPMHGGRKYHKSEKCSQMIEPRQVPEDCAIELEFGSCGRCYD